MKYDANGYDGTGYVGFSKYISSTGETISNNDITLDIVTTKRLENYTEESFINDKYTYNGEQFIGWEVTIPDLTQNVLIVFGLANAENVIYYIPNDEGEEPRTYFSSSLRVAFSPAFNTLSTPVVDNTLTLSSNTTISDLKNDIGGSVAIYEVPNLVNSFAETGVNTYEASVGGVALSDTTTLVNGKTYYVSAIENGSDSWERTPVTIALNNAEVLNVNAATTPQTCSSELKDATLTVSVTGGTPPYTMVMANQTYAVSTYTNSVTVENMEVGTHTFTISDINTVTSDVTQTVYVSEELSTSHERTPEITVTNNTVAVAGEGTPNVWWGTTPDVTLKLFNDDNSYEAVVETSDYWAEYEHVFIDVADGLYEIIVSNESDDCNPVYYSGQVIVGDVLSTNVFTIDDTISLYPNPTSTSINLPFTAVKIIIYNMSGQKLIEKTSVKNVDVSMLTAGVYTMQIVFNGVVATKRFIKE